MLSRMGEAAKRIATYADLEALPPNVVGEIIDGELHTMPRPAPRHAVAHGALITWSTGHFRFGNQGSGEWWILPEPELHLGGHVLVPDIAGWRKSRMPVLPETAFFSLAPDWICEVLSSSTQVADRGRKMDIYARESVQFAWLLDPIARLLEVYELDKHRWYRCATHSENDRVRVPPFQEVELDLALLWA